MTFEQAVHEFDEIIKATAALTAAEHMSIPSILAMMARIQTSQVKVLAYLMMEVERLKGGER
jgi:hypothetical protein